MDRLEPFQIEALQSAIMRLNMLLTGEPISKANSNHAAITINGSGATALLVALIGILAIVVAVAAVLVQKAEHRADMLQLEVIRAQQKQDHDDIQLLAVKVDDLYRRTKESK